MKAYPNIPIETISSIFTRERGYIKLQTSPRMSRKKAVNILNSFIPQGASPDACVRICIIDQSLGIGYYWMEDPVTIRITAILTSLKSINNYTFFPPLDLKSIQQIAKGEKIPKLFYQNKIVYQLSKWINNFGSNNFSKIIYSILSGDNLLIVHQQPEIRLNFIKNLFSIFPSIIFNYNRITTNCSELDGNKNIVGVAKLPRKYRSYKKLYLPLDSIFIDLESFNVEGEGVKKSIFTNNVAETAKINNNDAWVILDNFFESIKKPEINKGKYDEVTFSLIKRIQSKLGISEPVLQEWIMF